MTSGHRSKLGRNLSAGVLRQDVVNAATLTRTKDEITGPIIFHGYEQSNRGHAHEVRESIFENARRSITLVSLVSSFYSFLIFSCEKLSFSF